MSVDLTKVNEADLQAELKRRGNERKVKRNAWRKEQFAWVRENIDRLLAMRPEHSASSCSDTNPGNYTSDGSRHAYRCVRCQLLHIKQDDYNAEWVVDVTLKHDPEEELSE